jgi:aryl-alcohol dehydrogenase-like predicted oxidoreductase
MMERRTIGSLSVSVVGLGCNNFGWRIDAARTTAVVHAAIDAGINFFDTADTYGKTESEVFLGHALGDRRQQVVVATKFGSKIDEGRQGARPEYVRRAVNDSLRRLGTDYIDLYQLHRPDPTVPIADTLGALQELVSAGKVREIGCSNFSVTQLREAERVVPSGHARFVSVQNEFSLLHRDPEEGLLDECARQRVAFLPYFPLASGLLTGKYRLNQPVPEGTRISEERYAEWLSTKKLEVVEQLIAFAEARGHSILELAFSWLLAHGVVASVIAGATSPEQVRSNARASGWRLTPGELDQVRNIVRDHEEA